MEFSANLTISEMLAPYNKPIENCYECGVEVPTLPCKRSKEIDLLLSALFLKRSLTDLRAIWLLLLQGYTSQAGSIAAATFENALMSSCIAGDLGRAEKLSKSETGESPWKVVDLCKIMAKQSEIEAKIINKPYSQANFEIEWMELYGSYKWLCKIKHPTIPSTLHDAFAASVKSEEYVVMAVPDLRPDDLPNKFTILSITISRIHAAIRNFAFSCELNYEDDRVQKWLQGFNSIIPASIEAYKSLGDLQLPFTIENSQLSKKFQA